MDVSIIIVNWNTKGLLRDCLRSIYDRTADCDYEVIVVDNASGDGSPEMVRAEFPDVVLVPNTDNKGFPGANNQGIAIARGRYVLLLNSDTVVLDNAITQTVSFADTQPRAAVVGCRVLNPDHTLQPTCFMFPSLLNMFLQSSYLYKLFPKSRLFGREQMTWWNRDDVRHVDVITGCFMLVRRDAIEQVGVMDEAYFMYCEETDWCYRFKKNGWDILFAPVGEIIHYGGQSTLQKSVEMGIRLRLSILRFIRKHRSRPVFWIARLLVALFFIMRLPIWLAVICFRPARRKEASIKLQTYLIGTVRALFGTVTS